MVEPSHLPSPLWGWGGCVYPYPYPYPYPIYESLLVGREGGVFSDKFSVSFSKKAIRQIFLSKIFWEFFQRGFVGRRTAVCGKGGSGAQGGVCELLDDR